VQIYIGNGQKFETTKCIFKSAPVMMSEPKEYFLFPEPNPPARLKGAENL
jgi:hypothetical protein